MPWPNSGIRLHSVRVESPNAKPSPRRSAATVVKRSPTSSTVTDGDSVDGFVSAAEAVHGPAEIVVSGAGDLEFGAAGRDES